MRWWWLIVLVVLATLGGAEARERGRHSASDIPTQPVNPNAFYVATTGSDSNAGTLAAPFATLGKAQAAMRASGTIKTTYIRAGTYSLTSVGTACTGGTDGIELMSTSDNGETWSSYPLDGANTAIIDGGSTSTSTGLTVAFCIGGPTNITIDGLQIQRFNGAAIYATGGTHVFQNNIIHDINMPTGVGLSGISITATPNTLVTHNYIYNTRDNAVGLHTNTPGDSNNVTFSYNFTYNTCTGDRDCGGLYIQDYKLPASTGLSIVNNYIRDSGVGQSSGGYTGGVGVYLDDGASNVTISGNVITGVEDYCFQIHGGRDNTIAGNICDESSAGVKIIAYFQQTPLSGTFPMTGNTVHNNIITAGSAGTAGAGYNGDATAPATPTVQNNAYFNYVGSAVNFTGTNGGATDSSPTYVDPQINCWAYNISPGSPVMNPPVNFPGITGGWGPPGFVVTQTGTVPSSPHGC